MAARRLILVCLVAPLLALALSGCVGGDKEKAPEVAGTFSEEIGSGLPPATFKFDDVSFAPTGTVKKEMECIQNSPIVGLIFGCSERYRVNWTISGLVPLGTGENGAGIGEVFYQVWLGKEQEDGSITWGESGEGPQAGKEGEITGATDLRESNIDYTALRVTVETASDSQQEIPILETTEIAKEVGDFEVADLKTFEPSFGDARVTYVDDNKAANVSITAFSLPKTTGTYDAFLKSQAGEKYLGSLEIDEAGGLGLKLRLSADQLAGNWQLYLSLESADETHQEHFSGFKVMTSKFTQS